MPYIPLAIHTNFYASSNVPPASGFHALPKLFDFSLTEAVIKHFHFLFNCEMLVHYGTRTWGKCV